MPIVSATIFLRAMLCDGPEPVQLIFTRGRELGFSRDQLKTAKKADGIQSIPERDGCGGKIIKWWWG